MIGATLFSGIGAPEGAMPTWDWPWHAEIEKFPNAVMRARHPGSTNLGDVTADGFETRARRIARPDVIIFGSPCQDFSIAGRRIGLDGARGNLALTALRIVARLKPRWFVFENVPGLLSNWSGGPECPPEPGSGIEGVENGDFAAFLGTVDELGYSGAWAGLDAQYRGLAQRRDRLFFVGHSGDWRYPAAVLFEPESLCGDSPPRRKAGKGLAPTIASRPTGGGGLGTDLDCAGGLIGYENTGQGWWNRADVAAPPRADGGDIGGGSETLIAKSLNAHPSRSDWETETFVSHALRAEGFDASEDGTGRGTPLVPIAVALRGREGGGTAELSDVPSALRAAGGGGDKAHVLTVAGPITSSMGKSIARAGKEVGVTNGVVSASAVRRLTPRECERLQGFPDDYTLIDFRGKPAADGPRYKALGNSMAVPVIRWILQRIEIADA